MSASNAEIAFDEEILLPGNEDGEVSRRGQEKHQDGDDLAPE